MAHYPGEFSHVSHQGQVPLLPLIAHPDLGFFGHNLGSIHVDGDVPKTGASDLFPASPLHLSHHCGHAIKHPPMAPSHEPVTHPTEPVSEAIR